MFILLAGTQHAFTAGLVLAGFEEADEELKNQKTLKSRLFSYNLKMHPSLPPRFKAKHARKCVK